MSRIGSVRAGVTSSFRAFLARYPGVSADRLIRDAGIDLQRIGDRDAVIDQLQWVSLLEAAAEATDDPCFGIEMALQMPWRDLGVLAYVVLHSPTAGVALANSVRFLAVQQTGGVLALERGGISYTIADPRIVEYGQHAESAIMLLVRMLREATGNRRWAPRELTFRHAGPPNTERHRRLFGAPVEFGRRSNTMVLAPGDLDLPFISADAGLLPVLERHATECLNALPRTNELTDEVRGALVAAIGAGDPSIEAVATRLGTSARSLQRRLQTAGLSFKEIVDETRLALSERYLADPTLSLTETAYLLGYSDLSAFSRAFRRWTGKTALEVRRVVTTGTSRASS